MRIARFIYVLNYLRMRSFKYINGRSTYYAPIPIIDIF